MNNEINFTEQKSFRGSTEILVNRYIAKAEAAMRNVRRHRLTGNTRRARYWNNYGLDYCLKGLKLMSLQAGYGRGIWKHLPPEAKFQYTSACGVL